MSDRRFTDKPDLDPSAVRELPADHAAMRESRTLFPTTVVEVTAEAPDRILVSGVNNRKLGSTVEKGAFKGYSIYQLSLEERATCPEDCSLRGACYGNGMQLARRHRIGDPDVFYERLGMEIAELAVSEHPEGVLIRLHVLGDFPSVEYVAFWADALAEYPNLAVFGYTHRSTKAWGGDEIGDAIEAVKAQYPSRFRIRWSSDVSRDDGAMVIDHVPETPRIDEGFVCPAQTDATACCATCGLCWDASIKPHSIVFIKHGPKSNEAAAKAAMGRNAVAQEQHEQWKAARDRMTANPVPDPQPGRAARPLEVEPAPPRKSPQAPVMTREKIAIAPEGNHLPAPPTAARPINPISLPRNFKPGNTNAKLPVVRDVDPKCLLVEPAYQRDLTGKSIKLIRKIVAEWSWSKFKPPICAETSEGLFVIDGQHTAIAAASHGGIPLIPVMVMQVDLVERRAEAFVAHNRDRIAMTPLQIFHAEVAAGNKVAREVLKSSIRAGVTIPRSPTGKGGEVLAIHDARRIYEQDGAEILDRVLRIAALSKVGSISRTLIRALRMICKEQIFAETSASPDDLIANAIGTFVDIDRDAGTLAATSDMSRDRACACLIADACKAPAEEAA